MTFFTHPSLAGRLVSRSAFLDRAASSGASFHKLVVGVAIVLPATKPLRILLVQRAAHEKDFPGVYELPGGHVEDSDKTILDAAIREAMEETGLTVSNIVGEIPPFEYSVEKIFAAEGGAVPAAVVRSTIQLNFMAQVLPLGSANALEVKLNPEEHQNYAWVSKEDLGRYNISQGMIEVVKNALVWAEQNLERFDTVTVTDKEVE